jgi:hypothetical protein
MSRALSERHSHRVREDLGDNLGRLARALKELREHLARVMFVPDNHEPWIRGEKTRIPSRNYSLFESSEKTLGYQAERSDGRLKGEDAARLRGPDLGRR